MLGHGRAGLIHSTQSAPEAHKYVNMGLQPMPLPQKLGQRAVAGRIRSGGLKVIYLYSFVPCYISNGACECVLSGFAFNLDVACLLKGCLLYMYTTRVWCLQREPQRQWKTGAPLLPDHQHFQSSKVEGILTPPHRLQPMTNVPGDVSDISVSTKTKRHKKATKTSERDDSVQDALSKIKNARKRHPGASFLAHDARRSSDLSLPDTSAVAFTGGNPEAGTRKHKSKLKSTEFFVPLSNNTETSERSTEHSEHVNQQREQSEQPPSLYAPVTTRDKSKHCAAEIYKKPLSFGVTAYNSEHAVPEGGAADPWQQCSDDDVNGHAKASDSSNGLNATTLPHNDSETDSSGDSIDDEDGSNGRVNSRAHSMKPTVDEVFTNINFALLRKRLSDSTQKNTAYIVIACKCVHVYS